MPWVDHLTSTCNCESNVSRAYFGKKKKGTGVSQEWFFYLQSHSYENDCAGKQMPQYREEDRTRSRMFRTAKRLLIPGRMPHVMLLNVDKYIPALSLYYMIEIPISWFGVLGGIKIFG